MVDENNTPETEDATADQSVEPRPDPEEEAAKDNGGLDPAAPEQHGHEPDRSIAREV